MIKLTEKQRAEIEALLESPRGLRPPDKIEPAPDGDLIFSWISPCGTQIALDFSVESSKLRAVLATGETEWPSAYGAARSRAC